MIIAGGTFSLKTSSVALAGAYTGGAAGPGTVTPLFPGNGVFCKETFGVSAELGPTASPPVGFVSIISGTASALLTHFGIFTAGDGCEALAATIIAGRH